MTVWLLWLLTAEFNCYVNAGQQANSSALGAVPQFVNYTAGNTFCYRAQMPNGLVTCANDTSGCTTQSFIWSYGVLDKQGYDSFVATEALGIYKNVLCCAVSQCNAPDPSLDTTTVKLVNADIPTVDATTTTPPSNVLPNTTTTVITTASGTSKTAATTSGASLAGTGPQQIIFIVLCLAAGVAAF